MLDSVNRVMGRTDADWQIRHEPADQRHKDGMEELKAGQTVGFAKAMYSSYFGLYKTGEPIVGLELVNDALGLPKEDLDEVTKTAVDLVQSGFNPFGE